MAEPDEAPKNFAAVLCVNDLEVKLHAEDPAALVGHRGVGATHGGGDILETRRERRHFVPVGHPHAEAPRESAQKRPAVAGDRDLCVAVLFRFARLHRASKDAGDPLVPVADAEYRNAELKDPGIPLRAARLIDALWAAGEDDAGGFAELRRRRRGVADL